jgi:hypothetical protein
MPKAVLTVKVNHGQEVEMYFSPRLFSSYEERLFCPSFRQRPLPERDAVTCKSKASIETAAMSTSSRASSKSGPLWHLVAGVFRRYHTLGVHYYSLLQ